MTHDEHDVMGRNAGDVTALMLAQRGKLLTVDQAREHLASTEPLSQISFGSDDRVKFRLDSAWEVGLAEKDSMADVDAYVRVNGTEYRMTKDAVLEAAAAFGMSRGLATKTPARLLEPQLNYWLTEAGTGRAVKLLGAGTKVFSLTRATIQPFSNLRLFDIAADALRERYHTDELLVDYKMHHDLRSSHVRLVVPESVRQIESGREADPWSVGIQFRNSLSGVEATQLNGYLFAWWCTNGATSTHASSGTWSRRAGQGEEVYEWARQAVDEILGGLEGELDAVQQMTTMPIEGEANEVLRDVFEQYRIPGPVRSNIIENMVETDDLTQYGLMQAVTQAANDADLPAGQVAHILEVGGDLPRAVVDRCEACRRMLPH